MEFIKEPGFNEEEYQTWLRRLHYDGRDVIMYENMLQFLWSYIIVPDRIKDREGLLEEYTHWNLQMIDKCYYHMPHDLPYVNIRRAYQSLIHLFDGNLEEGLKQLALIGKAPFCEDGRPPKLHMTKQGRLYQPVSRLFLVYNYAKILLKTDPERLDTFKEEYPYAFRSFGDHKHDAHDFFLHDQMQTHGDEIFYPEFERVYILPGGAREFYLYFDEDHGIPIDYLPHHTGKQEEIRL